MKPLSMKPLSAITVAGQTLPGEDVLLQGRGTSAPLPRLPAGGRLELKIVDTGGEGLLVEGAKGRFLLTGEGEALAALRRSVTPGRGRIVLVLPRGKPADAAGRVPARLVAVDGRSVDIEISLRPPPPPAADRPPARTAAQSRDSAPAASLRQASDTIRPPFEATILRAGRPSGSLAVRLEPAPAAGDAADMPVTSDLAAPTLPVASRGPPSPVAEQSTAAPSVVARDPPLPVAEGQAPPPGPGAAFRQPASAAETPSPALSPGTDRPVIAVVTGRDPAGRLLLRLSEEAPAGLLRIEEPGLDVPEGSRLVVRIVHTPAVEAEKRREPVMAQPLPGSATAPAPNIVMTEAGATLRLFAYLLRRAPGGGGEPAHSSARGTEPQPPASPGPAAPGGAPETGALAWLLGAGEPVSLRIGTPPEGDEAAKETGSRWVFALELAEFGAIRLELWARGSGRQLAVRSERPLPEEVRRQIADLFGAALEISGNRGWLLFTGLSGGGNGAPEAVGGGILA